ncbi:PAS domain-containing protein [Streptomyces bacillaris]|uniref:PAS domain-containing protein n=1 Tax=Streptomyces bacillaris TaxID=68179 RepID=UPI003634E0A1
MSPMPGGGRSAAAVDALPDGLVFVDGNGTVVGANARALALFEAGGDTGIVGRGLLDLLPDFDWRDVPGPVGRMRGRRTDGGVFAADVVAVRLEDGGEHGLMLVVRDLTGVLDAETALADARRQTEAVLRAVGEGVVGTDAEGRIVLVNPAAAQLMGYRASALGAGSCTRSCCTPVVTASRSRSRIRRSPTRSAPGAGTGSRGRCCGPGTGTGWWWT